MSLQLTHAGQGVVVVPGVVEVPEPEVVLLPLVSVEPLIGALSEVVPLPVVPLPVVPVAPLVPVVPVPVESVAGVIVSVLLSVFWPQPTTPNVRTTAVTRAGKRSIECSVFIGVWIEVCAAM